MKTQPWFVLSVLALLACDADRSLSPVLHDASSTSDAASMPDAVATSDAGHADVSEIDTGGLDAALDAPAAACRLDLDADSLVGAWDPRFTIAGFTGPDGHSPTAYDFARDVDGSLLVAGEFRYVAQQRVEPLLRLRNGVWEPARTHWELTPPGSGFSAVAVSPDGKLALATYDDFGPRSGQIWLDDGSGLRVIASFDGLIRRLYWYHDELWAAGWHQIREGKATFRGLAVWNGTTWSAPLGGRPDGFVFELVRDGNSLLIGGDFTTIGGLISRGVVSFDGKKWTPMRFDHRVSVYALARGADGQIYAGGALGDLGGGGGGIARWTGRAWVPVAGGLANRTFPGVVTDLTPHAGSLYVAGCFFTAGGVPESPDAVVSRDIARFDGAWHSLDDDTRAVFAPWIEPRGCGDEGPNSVWDVSKQAMFSTGDRLLLAGSFPGIDGTLSQAMISYDGTAWRPEGAPHGLGIGGSLDRLGIDGSTCELWGSGQISHAAGQPTRARVVHFTGDGWQPIADAIPRDASCPGFAVSPTGDVALGCSIFPDGSDPVGRVYRVRGDQLVQVGGDQPLVQAVAYDRAGTLWIGGGGATGFVARLDGDTFTTVEAGFDAPVLLLDAVGPTDVIASGAFTSVGGVAASQIARWNGTAWRPLGDGLPGVGGAGTHQPTNT
jgi:hypothetical protein